MFLKNKIEEFTNPYLKQIDELKRKIEEADYVVIGAGSGLSTAAGMTYDGSRFDKYFFDLKEKFGIQDMYTGGFYDFPTPEAYWAFWSRSIWINRYMSAPKNTYQDLLSTVQDKDYFVITTNVDHQFQLAGFDKQRLFYTQGDYGLFQKKGDPDHTFDNYALVRAMIESQGFKINDDNSLSFKKENLKTEIAPELAEKAEDYVLNLRIDDDFVEDQGWHRAASRFNAFIQKCKGKNVVFLELGVGMNTPVIIKYPFWSWTLSNPEATFATVDAKRVIYPKEIADRTVAIKGDIDLVLKDLDY
ncbi:MAG: Sir2 silent information regulator family NAD-dependent deacetylase [Lactobacillus sp.]